MAPLRKLSPARSRSSAGSSVLSSDSSSSSSSSSSSATSSYAMYRQERQQPGRKRRVRRSPRFIVAALAVIVFITQFGASLSDVPAVHLLQEIICREAYGLDPGSPVHEGNCRTDGVQAQLNVLSTGALILGYIPGILVALPYGAVADRRGRKPVLGLCILGMILSQLIFIAAAWNYTRWDLRTIWLSCLPLLIGGGETVAEAMVFAIVADVSPEEKRATYFQFEICAVLLAEAIAPFVASAMMAHSVWIPIAVSPAIMTLGGVLLCLVPETLDTSHNTPGNTRRKVIPSIPTAPTFTDRVHKHLPDPTTTPPPSHWARLCDCLASTARLLRSRDILAVTPGASLTIPAATVTMGITLRYIPIRFGWSLEQTGMVLGVRTGLNILVLLALLPLLGNFLMSRQDDSDRDMVLARISSLLLVAGQIVFASAPDAATACAGLAVLTLGTGLPSLCRAVLTRLVDRSEVGRLFGVLAVAEMVGFLCCGVGLGAVFQAGLARGLDSGHGLGGGDGDAAPVRKGREGWLALVFYVVAVIYVMCASLLWLVRKGGGRGDDGDGGGGDGASISSAASSASLLHEARILADGRVTRKYSSLENVAVGV